MKLQTKMKQVEKLNVKSRSANREDRDKFDKFNKALIRSIKEETGALPTRRSLSESRILKWGNFNINN